MQDPKQYRFTLAFVGCLGLALILGCSSLKEIANSARTTAPAASPTNTAPTSSSPASTADVPDTASSSTNSSGLTLAKYDRLRPGLDYPQVVQILGIEGKKSGELGGKEMGTFKVEIYQWGGGSDGEITVFFKDGQLDKKLQSGLK